MNFSISGEIHEVDPDGNVVWKLVSDVGGALGYSTRIDDLNAGDINPL